MQANILCLTSRNFSKSVISCVLQVNNTGVSSVTRLTRKAVFLSSPVSFKLARVEVPAPLIPAGGVAPARDLEDESTGVANAEFVLNLLEARGEGELPGAAHREGPRVDL